MSSKQLCPNNEHLALIDDAICVETALRVCTFDKGLSIYSDIFFSLFLLSMAGEFLENLGHTSDSCQVEVKQCIVNQDRNF